MVSKSFIIFVESDHWPEAFEAAKNLGEAGGVMPRLITLRTPQEIDTIRATLRSAGASGRSYLIAEVGDFVIDGSGTLAEAALILHP